ncbi:two-component sensor histidine kinase [Bacteroidia bacterium]|nr:two-component sensor histidine kinase [Bacteroidia bacterium]
MKTPRDIYSRRNHLNIIFMIVLAVIVTSSMYFTNRLANKLSLEEKRRMEFLAEATRYIVEATPEQDISLALRVIENNTTIPVIIIDENDNLIDYRNIEFHGKDKDRFFKEKVQEFKEQNPPIEINIASYGKQYFYYENSLLLTELSYFPYIQLLIIIAFCVIVLYALLSTKKAEQNQVWVGLSRETAHQLGTPISSLLAWVEILKSKQIEPRLIDTMSEDVNRLRTIAERFSKIGSQPDIEPQRLGDVLQNAANYIRNRTSNKVKIDCRLPEEEIILPLNISLFEWVIENLCKNAIDAMDGTGEINITVTEHTNNVFIDVRDTGKGIVKSKQKTIFNPGFTTKKRGWGLGLSLVKRIVEEYHGGKIFVKHSEINQGTTFRIILPKNRKL